MARHRIHLRLFCITAAAVVTVGVVPPLVAAADTTTLLSVDQSRILNTAVQMPVNLRGCADVPGGAVDGSDGWVFTQPVPNPVAFAYSIGFIEVTPAGPQAVLLLVTGAGVSPVPLDEAQSASAPMVRAGAAAAARQAASVGPPSSDGKSPSPTPSPSQTPGLPPGVTGGLITSGPDGVWLQTPEGWILAAAYLEVAVTTDLTTFDIGAVCPAPDSLGTPSPSPSPSPSPGGSASRSPSPQPTPTTAAPRPTLTDVATLPRTGTDIGGLAALGACLIAAGLILLRIRRRNEN